MLERKYFDDGSYIEWESKEGLRYVEDNYVALIWVDFTAGLFSNKRIIKLSSLRKWHRKPDEAPERIPDSKSDDIIQKVGKFYRKKQILLEDDK